MESDIWIDKNGNKWWKCYYRSILMQKTFWFRMNGKVLYCRPKKENKDAKCKKIMEDLLNYLFKSGNVLYRVDVEKL